MKKVFLANTGIEVSCVGFGTVKFGRNEGVKYPESFELPNENQMTGLLDLAQELGINLLDTAPAYGDSEERLGKILKGRRHEWVICTKAGEEFVNGESFYEFSKDKIRKSIERSLQRLKTDYLDIVLIHSNGEDEKIIKEDHVFETLADMKKEGLIRAYGMSTKTVAGGILAVDQSDVVMVTYNPQSVEERPVIQHAKEKNKGIFIKKAFASGHLVASNEDAVLEALKFIFAEPGVTSVILGTLNPWHLIHNVKCAEQVI